MFLEVQKENQEAFFEHGYGYFFFNFCFVWALKFLSELTEKVSKQCAQLYSVSPRV